MEPTNVDMRVARDGLGLYVLINRRCNLTCDFCFQKNHDFQTGSGCTPEAVASFKKLIDTHPNICKFTFLGGESFLDIWAIKEILEYLVIQNVKRLEDNDTPYTVSFITNGTIYIPWLKDFSNIIHIIQISIDGGPESHNRYRKYKNGVGSYDIVISNLNKYHKDGLRVGAHGVITNHTIKPWLSSVGKLLADVPKDITVAFEIDHVNNTNFFSVINLRAKIAKRIKKALTTGEHPKVKANRFTEIHRNPHISICGAGTTLLGLDLLTGDMYACHEQVNNPDFIVGNINNENIVDPDKLDKYINYANPAAYKIQLLPRKLSSAIIRSFGMQVCPMENIAVTGKWNIIPLHSVFIYVITQFILGTSSKKDCSKCKG